MDGFDRLPDSLILLIFKSVSDVKSLIRCRSVSKRFNSLVPQTESIFLKIDLVISSESDSDSVFLTLLKSFLYLIFPKPALARLPNRTQTYPGQILSRFQRIRELHVELPAGDLHLEKGTVVKWRAEFGETLKSCVIFGFRLGNSNGNYEAEFGGGLKTRVMWTISALIAASVRHYLLREVVREHKGMEELVVTDRDGEGVVVVDKQGLREWRKARESHVVGRKGKEDEEAERGRGRTVVPSVRMRMRHEPRLGATLVVVRAVKDGAQNARETDVEDADLALTAFGSGVYGNAVRQLLKVRSYLLEMNSF